MVVMWEAEEAEVHKVRVFASVKTECLSKRGMLWRSLPEASGERLFSLPNGPRY